MLHDAPRLVLVVFCSHQKPLSIKFINSKTKRITRNGSKAGISSRTKRKRSFLYYRRYTYTPTHANVQQTNPIQ